MSHSIHTDELYQLNDETFDNAYAGALVAPLRTFLVGKAPGHCQRIDYLPRTVLEPLGRALTSDAELQALGIVVRVVTPETDPTRVEAHQVTGSGAVTLREAATNFATNGGATRVFCALFPPGLRLDVEDSLNVATFKTDDARTFDLKKCLKDAIDARLSEIPDPEAAIVRAVLSHDAIRRLAPAAHLRFVLAVLGERARSVQPVSWEVAGAYLYHLELVPDFNLDADKWNKRAFQNQTAVKALRDGERNTAGNIARLTEAGLDDADRVQGLTVFFALYDAFRPEVWLPVIAHQEAWRDRLSFECWKWSEPSQGVRVTLTPLQDPKVPSKTMAGLKWESGALVSDGKAPITVKWTVAPKDASDLAGFRVFVLRRDEDGADVDIVPPLMVSGARKKQVSVPLAGHSLEEDEKHVVIIRVQAIGKNGAPLGKEASDDSEEFWIDTGGTVTATPSERGQRVRCLDDLLFRDTYRSGKAAVVRARGWNLKQSHIYSVRLESGVRGDLVMSPLLLSMQRSILEEPDRLGALEASIIDRRTAEKEDFAWSSVPPSISADVSAQPFFEARRALFQSLRDAEDGRGVVEVVDLTKFASEIEAYAETYASWLQSTKARIEGANGAGALNNALHDSAFCSRLDTIKLTLGPRAKPFEVLLLCPTHPLRLAWLLQYSLFVRGWNEKIKGQSPEVIRAALNEDSLDKIVSLNVPAALCWCEGQAFVGTEAADFFWALFPDANLDDVRSASNAALQAVWPGRREVSVSTLTPAQIASKIERYLAHHPYVRTLRLNVLNPGDGAMLLEALKALLERRLGSNAPPLDFDLKFFAPRGAARHLVASAFDDLLEGRTSIEGNRSLSVTEEHLLQPNANPLFPKFIYAKHFVEELIPTQDSNARIPRRFEAHLTFVIDSFAVKVTTSAHSSALGSSSLHNLLAEYRTEYSASAHSVTWSRLVAPNRCPPISAADSRISGALFGAQEHLAHLAAHFLSWKGDSKRYVTSQLELTDAVGSPAVRLLEHVHEISDWVLTIDRNFGVEFYDDPHFGPGGSTLRGYLIDYTPEFLDGVGHRLIISTFHRREVESILRAGFARLFGVGGVTLDTYGAARLLEVLQSVSGKLALKLINNPTQAQEVVGLTLARLHLEAQGRLNGAILIPIDSHVGLFHQTARELENSELTLKRTDLLLARLTPQGLELDLIEVKNYADPGPQIMVELRLAIRDKNKSTETHFRAHFGPEAAAKRFDAAISNKELANILGFYFERACRYNLFDDGSDVSSRAAFMTALKHVEDGTVPLSFKHEGMIVIGSSLKDVTSEQFEGNSITLLGQAAARRLLSDALSVVTTTDVSPATDTPASRVIESEDTPLFVSEVSFQVASANQIDEVSVNSGTSSTPAENFQEIEVPATPNLIVNNAPIPQGAPQLYREELSSEKAPPRTEVVRMQQGVILGQDTITGAPVEWNPFTSTPRKLSNQHLLIVGKSGAGKSETTKSLLWELNRQGVPSLIFDFQGEYASGPFFEAVQPQVFNVMDGLPVNPFELPRDPLTGQLRPYIEMVFRLADTLNTVFGGSGDIQLGLLREGIDECYRLAGFTRDNMANATLIAPTLDDLETLLSNWAMTRAPVRNLLVRLQPLFKSGIFQGTGSFSFDTIFERTTVLLLTSGIKDLMLAASRFMLEKTYAAMLMQGVSSELRLVACVDEAHKLCRDDTLTSLIKEARKYGLGVVLSSQETRDFHPSVFANTGTLISLALEDEDATVMAKHLGLTDRSEQRTAKDLILRQANGEALIRSQHFQPYRQIAIRSFEQRLQTD